MHEPGHGLNCNDWISTRLGDVALSVLGGTPSTDVPQFWSGGDIPWMASGDVNLRRVYDVPGRITAAGLAASNARLVPPPAVAVGLAGQGKTRGTVALTLCELSTNQSIALLRGDEAQLQTEYLFHNLDHRYEELRARSSGGGRGGLSKGILDAVPIDLPPLREQQVITEVLNTLDTSIRQTEAIIDKLKQVKQGLLNDLLSRGIDANGELRMPQRQTPHLYKDSPVGWIPKNWQVAQLGDLITDHQSGVYKDRLLYGEGTNIVGVADLFRNDAVAGQEFRRVRTSSAERTRFRLSAGDLIYAESSLVPDGIAKTLAVTEDGDGTLFAWHTRRLTPDRSRVNSFYLAVALGTAACRRYVISRATQTALTGMPVAEYMTTPVPMPPMGEQDGIVARLEAIEFRRKTEERYAAKLKVQKSGLMDDLLTGRVRVTALLEPAAACT